MGFFDFLNKNEKKEEGTIPQELAISKRLQTITANIEQLEKKLYNKDAPYDYYLPSPEGGNIEDYLLLPSDITSKEDILFLSSLLPGLSKNKTRKNKIQIELITKLFRNYRLGKIDLTDEELFHFLHNWQECRDSYTFQWSKGKLMNMVLARIQEKDLDDTLRNTLQLFRTPETVYMSADHRKVNERIDYMLQTTSLVPVDKKDEWGRVIANYIESKADEKLKLAWADLIKFCLDSSDKTSPPKNWLPKAKELINKVGHDEFAKTMIKSLAINKESIIAVHKNEKDHFLTELNHNILRGLVWCTGLVNDPELQTAVDQYALVAFKKKPSVGPISAKTGTAAMFAFSLLPFKEAVTRLMKFRNKIINNNILKSIDRIISEVAAKNGYDKNLIKEIGVMDFGLDELGNKKIEFGSVTCNIQARNAGDVIIEWKKDDKPIKSVPATVKKEFAGRLKELKNDIKELEAQLQVQKDRIESYYLEQKVWKYNEWLENYITHPLVKVIASKLIWLFKKEDINETGLLIDNKFFNVKNELITWLDENVSVELWHPINSNIDEIVSWRNFIQEKEITQPFKQAYREIYLLTDAELNTNTYSNRFAAHILRQHQFAALCKQRSWQYHLMGQWDSHNTPTIQLPVWNMTAQYYVDADGNAEANNVGVFNYISTDQVRFYQGNELLQLINVPKIVFSEIMRDVDLFVGVTSIGNDPNWTNTGNEGYNAYWHGYSFGELTESARMRSEVLQKLIPRLKIADKCSFDKKYLIVKGKLRTYKIHMGSGNIMMEPNDQYLCIVPGGRTEKDPGRIYLPFEGDRQLSVIISKALLLAEDDKIKDVTITRQIK